MAYNLSATRFLRVTGVNENALVNLLKDLFFHPGV
jgi:hypothetical protein